MIEQKMRLMIFIIFFLVIVIVLLIAAMTKVSGEGRKNGMSEIERSLPYEKKKSLAKQSESIIYNQLQSIVGENFIVLFKVSLKDFIDVKSHARSEKIHLTMIERKYLDFLVCDKNTMEPVYGIELDKQNIGRLDKLSKSEFVHKVYKVIGLEIINISEKEEYTESYLRKLLNEKLKGEANS